MQLSLQLFFPIGILNLSRVLRNLLHNLYDNTPNSTQAGILLDITNSSELQKSLPADFLSYLWYLLSAYLDIHKMEGVSVCTCGAFENFCKNIFFTIHMIVCLFVFLNTIQPVGYLTAV